MADLSIRSLFAGRNAIGAVKANDSLQRTAFKLRQMGDRCRNRRNWPQARGYYQSYLEMVPEDAAIWVQYGHACKELGDLDAAEAAYGKSIEIAPGSDAYVALGRVLKSKGEIVAAGAAFRKAIELEAGCDLGAGLSDGKAEARGLPVPHGGATTLPKRVLIDLSDVLIYLRQNNTVSGIQRVQLGLADALFRMLPSLRYRLTFVCAVGDGWREIDNTHLINLIKKMSRPRVDPERLEEAVYQIEADALGYEPAEGDIFLVLGAFWAAENLADHIIAVQRAGARVAILIHDLLQITHPEFVDRSATDRFQWFLDDLLPITDFILTVSDHTAHAVRQYLQNREIPSRPVMPLRLAHRSELEPAENGFFLSPTVTKLLKRSYVLYVSTIEVRKNHSYLFHIWKRLKDELGDDIPTLLFVGKVGWRVNDLMEQLDNTDFLNRKIEIVEGLSDPELAELYRNCLFTVFPSFVEGWGLPVGESLVFGRPCLASHTSSLPEVAGSFVDYLDPFNAADGYEKIKKFIIDAEFREARAANIKANFRPRLWSDVANDLIRIIDERADDPYKMSRGAEPPVLHPGVVYRLGPCGDMSGFVRSGRASLTRAICDENWYRFEDWGRWMRGRSASIHFRLADDHPCDLMLVIELKIAEEFEGHVRIIVADSACNNHFNAKVGEVQRLIVKTRPEGRTVRIGFESMKQITTGDDPRPLSIGLRSIGYAGIDDLAARLSLFETLTARICDLRY